MNPIQEVINGANFLTINLDDVNNQFELRGRILALNIPGLVDVQFKEEPRTYRIIPVFATEQDYMWYHLKYNDNSL
jgi:hypothetical protein